MSEQPEEGKVDRTDEFLLVRRLRQLTNSIASHISEATRKDYIAKYERMRRTGYLPESAGTKRAYYAYRAALLHGTAQRTKEVLRQRDKAPYGSAAWQEAIAELGQLAHIFERYPPDPKREHRTRGSTSFTWKKVKQQKGGASNKRVTSRSKKSVLPKLRRYSEWRTTLFMHTSQQYQDSVAILALTGARPSELSHGVTVQLAHTKVGHTVLAITIKGSKVSVTTGQALRILYVSTDNPLAQHLMAKIQNGTTGTLIVTAKPSNLTAAVIKAGRKAFPKLSATVTPYVLRHALASDLKAQPARYSPTAIAQMLGHQATETQQYYGYAVCASGTADIVAVKTSCKVRQTHRQPGVDVTTNAAAEFGMPSPHF